MYRLDVVTLRVPPLRERKGDIEPLAEGFRNRFAHQFGLDDIPFHPDVVRALGQHDWPGNVRELENTIAGWLATSVDGRIDPASVSLGARAADVSPQFAGRLRQQVAEFESALLRDTLAETAGNHSEAARRLGVTRTTLLDKLRRHGLR
jgi:two-component system response regulator AtoC